MDIRGEFCKNSRVRLCRTLSSDCRAMADFGMSAYQRVSGDSRQSSLRAGDAIVGRNSCLSPIDQQRTFLLTQLEEG
jgi:hypothetical protein